MYQRFAHFLNALSGEDATLREALGDQLVPFARLLRDYPTIDPAAPQALDEFRAYARQVIAVVDREPPLRGLILNFFDEDDEIRDPRPSAQASDQRDDAASDLTIGDWKNVAKGRVIAQALGETLLRGPRPTTASRPTPTTMPARRSPVFDRSYGAPSGPPSWSARQAADTLAPTAGADASILAPAAGQATAPTSGPTSGTTTAPTTAASPSPRAFVATAHATRPGEPRGAIGPVVDRLRPRRVYKIRFGVTAPRADNRFVGETAVTDLPPDGLQTHWLVTSTDVDFVADASTVQVDAGGSVRQARFDLWLPPDADSAAVHLGVRIGERVQGTLHVQIFASRGDGRELYRELSVTLADDTRIVTDDTCASAAHTLPRPRHEWTTPIAHVQVRLLAGHASVTTVRGRSLVGEGFVEPFNVSTQTVSALVSNARRALERLREAFSDSLDALDDTDLAARLASHRGALQIRGDDGWSPLPDHADAAAQARFEALQASTEWLDLASAGYTLYQACFPIGCALRTLMDTLPAGSRIDVQWTREFDPNFVPHLPWTLMYRAAPDVTRRRPIDAEHFLGLRYRIGTMAWKVRDPSRALGDPDASASLQLLYWGDKPHDPVAAEARWQAGEFERWGHAVLPSPGQADAKRQLVLALDTPEPSPCGVLSLYCHCHVGDGDQVTLRFADSARPADNITQAELSQQPLTHGPLVFANACSTAQALPHQAGLLESLFFQRGARSFIGTETRVPVRLASKFAWLFFQFFDRRFDASPMAAGEALTQARLFLWTQYRHVGGLFYTQVNHYDLYRAADAEVRSLRD